MKEVIIYVEGSSDKLGLEVLLSPIIETASKKGTAIKVSAQQGKEPLLNKGLKRAANILINRPNNWVFIVPDLYPPNKPFPHRTHQELKEELEARFSRELQSKRGDIRLKDRFLVHCFKHDFEALILAAETSLQKRLKISSFSVNWKKPVENQDLENPPKRIVEQLFSNAGERYKATNDAPWILERVDYRRLMEECPQNFKPFVEDLLKIVKKVEEQ